MTGNGLSSFRWHPDFGISDNRSYDPVVSPTSTQTYMVTAIDTNSCNDTGYVKVTVHPKATVFLPDSITIYPGESYQMDPEGNAAYYSWFPPVGLSKTTISNPMAQPQVNTRYFVTATTEAGCTATDSINVIVDAESIISLPNAFSPGSNPNAEFKVLRRGDASLKSFTIFNRWGAKVFETSDINQGWNGQFKNEPQPMGVYIYVVEGTTASGRKFTKQGNVTLIR
jgi:gliding motility-associated-like protein